MTSKLRIRVASEKNGELYILETYQRRRKTWAIICTSYEKQIIKGVREDIEREDMEQTDKLRQ